MFNIAGGQHRITVVSRDQDAPHVVPFHPILFAVFPLLALYAINIGQVPVNQIYRPIGFAVLATLIVWGLSNLFMRNVRKAALAATVSVLLFFSYGHLMNLLPDSLHRMVAPGCVIALVALLVAIAKSRKPFYEMTRAMNLASVVVLVPSIYNIGSGLWANVAGGKAPSARVMASSKTPDAAPTLTTRHRVLSPVRTANLPDVYYVILDAYGRDDSLREFYSYDNTPFLQALEKRGFYIARHSRSNYDQTSLCIASALNMSYLDSLSDQYKDQGANLEPVREYLDDNAVAAYLSKLGYHFVYIWSGAPQTRIDTADLVLAKEAQMSSFEDRAIGLTALAAAPQTDRGRYDDHRDYLLSAFSNLNKVAKLPYPKFVFTHILAPHPPFVFEANGQPVYPKGPFNLADASWLVGNITKEQYRTRYIAQLQYVNKRVLQAVDSILKNSQRRPIIILQGDHGSRMNLNWESQEKTDLREPFSIFNAYYVPPKVRGKLYDTITPVNSFRVLLSQAFGAQYKPIKDRSFYSTAREPLVFSEVTNLITPFGASGSARKPPPIASKGAPTKPSRIRILPVSQ